ncbi:nucleotidyltransferase domain-containing protein [Jeotgalibacillus sp. ET6]|uniref:nucleotidyltransferase domain-containing protein n=1 Tax=Jeotgalibacillus sp. ET6 TaxID=3037260 RepID=UPI0024183FFB|nr:nucleotidyltransferase domain-containing protein [Jeotgalibacillus sp. ET6]MDG5472286.1 nucleotidyltransferase domain-containing protein [Jeotgalibacillus sp. ET6]
MTERLEAVKAAEQFINLHYPHCQAALLAGSVVRKEATAASDLDIVIFDQTIKSSYRSSHVEGGWPIEVFVHSMESYKEFFRSDCERARPSMPNMVAEGLILKNNEELSAIRKEAQALLDKGPDPWDKETLKLKRYFLTDALEDLTGSTSREEDLFIAGTLLFQLSDFILRTNHQWSGDSKWQMRALKRFDPDLAAELAGAFDRFYQNGEKETIVRVTERILKPHGGLLFDGFSIGQIDE